MEEKKIIKFGNSAGIVLDSKMLYKAEMELGEVVEVEVSKNKIVIKKKKEK